MLFSSYKTTGKRILTAVLVMACIGATDAIAQSAKVVTAYNYMKEQNWTKAKENIDAAAVHEKTMGQTKTWYYRGQIYESILASTDEQFKDMKGEALAEAYKSYTKALDIPSKRISADELKSRISRLSFFFFQNGVEEYNNKTYDKAIENFETCIAIKKKDGVVDSLAYYNIGLAAEQSGQPEKAMKNYRKCIEIGYNEASVYASMIGMLQEQEKDDETFALLKEARGKFPKDQALLTTEINLYIKHEKFEEALGNLDLAIENDPTNPVLTYVRGYMYNQRTGEGDMKKAEADYKKAIELKPDYFDAEYNLGALYFNRGADLLAEAKDIEDNTAYQKKKGEADELFKRSIPYLEKAHEINPADQSTMKSLLELYARTNQSEKYKAISEKLKN